MSTLSQFLGVTIKSIQRGSVTPIAATGTVTISSVNTAKTLVFITGVGGGVTTKSDGSNTVGGSAQPYITALAATSFSYAGASYDTILGSGSLNANYVPFSWQVVEFY